jgi:ribosome-binding protein aMBF1 (putative translation factor)
VPPAPVPFSLPYPRERLVWACATLGWSIGELARRLNIREDTARQMAMGRRNIPDDLGHWLEACVAIAETMPTQPEGWRSKTEGD